MNPLPQYPMFNEWQATIQANAELAEQQANFLKLQASMYGPYAPPILIQSIEDYERAHAQQVMKPESHSTLPPNTLSVTLEQSTLYPYPDEQYWRVLIADDPQAAQLQLFDLELQAARLGRFDLPFNLQASIENYKIIQQTLAANQPSDMQPELNQPLTEGKQPETEKR